MIYGRRQFIIKNNDIYTRLYENCSTEKVHALYYIVKKKNKENTTIYAEYNDFGEQLLFEIQAYTNLAVRFHIENYKNISMKL